MKSEKGRIEGFCEPLHCVILIPPPTHTHTPLSVLNRHTLSYGLDLISTVMAPDCLRVQSPRVPPPLRTRAGYSRAAPCPGASAPWEDLQHREVCELAPESALPGRLAGEETEERKSGAAVRPQPSAWGCLTCMKCDFAEKPKAQPAAGQLAPVLPTRR